ncbi:Tetratricopeptide repeat [Novymonas esmeraldas]|uniref:Tetratricopeptide repeat n=1 Tax=Novymonas esmeraldas TaxID=1808958 RepID=A0AAW0FC56_9TRYP
MPPKRGQSLSSAGARRGETAVKRRREGQRSEFSSSALHTAFEAHVTAAQNAFLRGDSQSAEKEATQALRIRPTAHLFALLAVVAESRGKFDQASDFRLLQAFLARDMVLWEELLHDFMTQQLYYKSVVCLQRMSALEKNQERYRALQLQLADLLIGLGEIRRASNVLVPLWNSSRCRDFEVFALLSALYFQLGKWASLQRLIESSVKHAFQVTPAPEVAGASALPDDTGNEGADAPASRPHGLSATPSAAAPAHSAPHAPATSATPRVSKRVRFFGVEGDSAVAQQATEGVAVSSSSQSPAGAVLDEFSFDDDVLSPASALSPSSQLAVGGVGRGAAVHRDGVVHQLYGERIELHTSQDRNNFLTLLNVHAELLNEQGSFSDTVQLLHMAAGCLEVDLMELPPDLLVRLGVAYAFLGDIYEQPCRDVFQHMVEHCSMEEYGDVLLDAATSLQKVGMHAEAAQLYVTLTRYHQFAYDRVRRQAGAADAALALLQDSAAAGEVQAAAAALTTMRAEEADLKTVLTAALQGQAQSAYAQGLHDEAREHAERVLQLDPLHLQARLLLGRYHFYQGRDTDAAVQVLTPSEHEPALQRIQLGVFLVHVFQRARRYIEAIALGVSIFELLLSSEEDGDTQSVAPGTSSRRSGASLYLPTMTRASSAIIPASSLSGMVGGGSSVAARTSFSLAASIKASTSVARQQLSRRGLESLTTTAYGASAAASLAAGRDRREEEEQHLKDTSTIFRFHRRRRHRAEDVGQPTPAPPDDATPEAPALVRPQTAEERRAAVMQLEPAAFWPTERGGVAGSEGEKEDCGPASTKAKTEAEVADSVKELVKEEVVDEAEGGSAVHPPAKRDREGNQAPEEPVSAPAAAAAPSSPRATKEKGTKRKKTERRSGGDADVGHCNNTTLGERDRDLEELEEFLTAAEAVANAAPLPEDMTHGGDDGADTAPRSDELPSLEEVSKQFQDPVMAQLFLDASNFVPGGKAHDGEASDGGADPWADLAAAREGNNTGAAAGAGPADKVTLREAVAVLGKAGFIALAVTVVECYSAVGQFTEAREFAFVSLTHFAQKRRLRQMGSGLERPLRIAVLRAALAAGEGEDAYRVGLRLLQEDTAEDKRHEVVELMHSVLNRCYDRSSILYRAVADGYSDPALIVLLANRYHQTRSYTRVLNLYLMALRERPTDVLLNFMVGLSYLFCSHQRRTRSREACVSAAIYYITQYQQLRLALEPTAAVGEVLYNVARALQFLKLYYLCIPLYERVAYDLLAPDACTVALQRAARVNLYFVYRWASGNRTLALTALLPRIGPGAAAASPPPPRAPSPFRPKAAMATDRA